MNVVSVRRAEREIDLAPEDQGEERGAQLRGIYATLVRRWMFILPVSLVAFGVVYGSAALSPRRYTATTLVLVDAGRPQVLQQDQMIDSGAGSYFSDAVASEIEVLHSQMLMRRLVETMALDEDPEWNGALAPPNALSAALAPIEELFRRSQGEKSDQPNIGPADIESVRDSIARAVGGAVDVRKRGMSSAIQVSVTTLNPRRSAEIANKLVELYFQAQTEARFDAAQRANGWLGQRLNELRTEVQQKEQAAETFRIEHGLSVAAAGDAQQSQNTEVQTMMVQSRADLAEKEARLRQVRELMRTGGSADSIASALDSEVIQSMRGREAELAREVARLQERYSADHPALQTARTQLENTRAAIQSEVQRITAGLQNEVDVARARLGTLQGSFGDIAGARGESSEAVIQYRQLVREATATRAVHDSFLQRFHEVAEQGDLPVASSRLISSATPPGGPSQPNMNRAFMIAMLLAAVLGVGAGFLVEILDSSLSGAEDVQGKVGVAGVASIPILRAGDFRGLLQKTPADYLVEKPMSGFAEALRVLRTSINHARVDTKIGAVAITSAIPNEGKTTLALCLARMTAMSGQRVLLIDCDLRRRSINDLIGIKPTSGILEVLFGEKGWRDVLIKDPDSAAHVLPASSSGFTPQDVFSSQAMRQLLQDVGNEFDLVILDCAPVLAIAETRTLAAHADITVVVARSGKTPATAVRSAVKELRKAGADVLGVALNCVDPRRPGRAYYGDAYYYRHAQKGYYQA